MSRSRTMLLFAAAAVSLAWFGATAHHANAAPAAAPAAKVTSTGPLGATATLSGPQVSGKVTFSQNGASVHVTAEISGATPGKHGFHIHEKGVCTAPDFKSAGGHFNPTGANHACMPTMPRHPGDFGNIEIGADGKGHLDTTVDTISLTGPNSIVGKAVIFHQGTDDCTTQPTGNAGDRAACGVINPVSVN